MAGSYAHIVNEDNVFQGTKNIENLRDANEALEECWNMIDILTGGDKDKIDEAHYKYLERVGGNVEYAKRMGGIFKRKERIAKDIKANKEMYGTKVEPIKSDCIELIQKVVSLFSPNIDTEKEQQQEDCLNECQEYLDKHKPKKDEYEQLREGVNKVLDESNVSESTKENWRNFTDDFIKRMKNK